MPRVDEKKLSSLLASGRISGVSLDTSIFDGQKLRLDSDAITAASALHRKNFKLILSSTVVREVKRHIKKQLDSALSEMKKSLGVAIFAFGVRDPSRDSIIKLITKEKSTADAAEEKLTQFLINSKAEVLDDDGMVNTKSVLEMYFNENPPFSHGKKTEFPDAFALISIEAAASDRDTCILVVSADNDWKKYCENSERLYIVDNIEKALSLIENVPDSLKRSVVEWLLYDKKSKDVIADQIIGQLERLDVDVTADPTSGQVDLDAWAPEIVSIDWPASGAIDIIETSSQPNGSLILVVSFIVSVRVKFTVEMAFSIWDSVDRESVGMGGRTVEHHQDEDVRVTITVKRESIGEENEKFLIEKLATDIKSFHLELGSVDVFDEDEYDVDENET